MRWPIVQTMTPSCRSSSTVSSWVSLSGDGLAWAEAWDEATAVTNTLSWAMDYAIWSGGVPPLTAKTFTITGGSASSNIGQIRRSVARAGSLRFIRLSRWIG